MIIGVVSCAADPRPSATKAADSKEEKIMAIYSKIFADFRQSSFQEQTTRAKGVIQWHCPPGEILPAQPPSVILATDDGLTVEYPDRLVRLGYNGSPIWHEMRDPNMRIVASWNNIYYRGPDHFLHGVDKQGKQLLKEFYIPNCFNRGRVQMVFPVDESHFLIQTYNMAKEVKEDKPPESDDHNFILMGPKDWNDWVWIKEYEGQAMPGLIAGDGAEVVCIDDQNQVISLDLKSGEEKNRFVIEDATVGPASLDRENNLLIFVIDEEENLWLRKYNLAGALQWKYLLTAGGEFPHQPPAIDGNNRVYCIIGRTLQVIDNGQQAWTQQVPAASIQYLTVLGDNSVVVVGGIEIDQFDAEGKELLGIELEDGAVITAPPVAGNDGRLYLGTKKGIYCLE